MWHKAYSEARHQTVASHWILNLTFIVTDEVELVEEPILI